MAGVFETAYNSIMDALVNKLKTDARLKEIRPLLDIQRGSPTTEPEPCPVCYVAEGQITDIITTSADSQMTIRCNLEYYVKSRNRVEGVREIRNLTLKLMDVLMGTIADRRLEISNVALADGAEGVRVLSADFGHFSPDDNVIIYRGVLEVAIDVFVDMR